MDEVKEWNKFQLNEVVEQLISNGFDTTWVLKEINPKDLDFLYIEKPGLKIKLRVALEHLSDLKPSNLSGNSPNKTVTTPIKAPQNTKEDCNVMVRHCASCHEVSQVGYKITCSKVTCPDYVSCHYLKGHPEVEKKIEA